MRVPAMPENANLGTAGTRGARSGLQISVQISILLRQILEIVAILYYTVRVVGRSDAKLD